MNTLRASQSGLILVDKARRRKGWNKSCDAWLGAAFISRSTLNRFWSGQAIRRDAFVSICSAVGIDWERVVEQRADGALDTGEIAGEAEALPPVELVREDWGGVPDIPIFCGRTTELATLERWVVRDRCRLVLLLGMGGIGKTALSVKLAQQIATQKPAGEFKFVIWRSLRNAPPVSDLLAELTQILSRQREAALPTSLDGKILSLVRYLRVARVLLILDNCESILQGGDRRSCYREGYEGYGQLLQAIGNTVHNSCLVLTSREKPQGIAAMAGDALPIRCLQLSGLSTTTGQEIFQMKGQFAGSDAAWLEVVRHYGGNPLALKIAAAAIEDLFKSDLCSFLEFLAENSFVFDDIRDLLAQQFDRLSPFAKSLMYWLAIEREPVALQKIQANYLIPVAASELINSLACLQGRSLVEKDRELFTQQPVVMEFVTEIFVERVCEEIVTGQISLFKSHFLIEARAKHYVRETQIRFILQAIIDRLMLRLGSPRKLEACVRQILTQLQSTRATATKRYALQEAGYACGNAINLLRQLQVDLTGSDFSGLPVLQANLQGLNLHHVNFIGSDLSRSVFTETLGNVLAAEFSPDGQFLATCDTDCQIRLWQVRTGQLLAIFQGHLNWVRSIAFSPDSQSLISGGADRTVRYWDIKTGKCLGVCTGHRGEVHAVTTSLDGKFVASGSSDGTLKLWDGRTDRCCHTFEGHSGWVRSVAFSPDGRSLASSSDDGTIKLWDGPTGTCLQTFTGHDGWARSVAFAGDGRTLASGGGDGTIKVWDVAAGHCIRTYVGHQDSVYSIALSRDGRVLASGSGDRTARLWDLATGRCIRTLSGHTNQVNSVTLNPDGSILACVSLDQTVRLWDCHGGHCFKIWYSHTDWAFPVAFAPRSPVSDLDSRGSRNLLASGSNDRTVKLWDTGTGRCVGTLQGHRDLIYAVAFSPDGKFLVSGSPDRTARVWEVNAGRCCHVLQGHTDWVYAVAFSPDGEFLATCSSDRTIRLWDWRRNQCLQTLLGHTDKIFNIAFSPDGSHLASASSDRTIALWSVATGEGLKIFRGHENRVYSVAFSPDGQTLASGSIDRTLKLWDVATGQCRKTLCGHGNWVFSVAFSPDGQTLASASHDGTVRIWDAIAGTCSHICEGHTHLASFVAFSPDGRQIASGSQDQTARLWDVETGQCLQVLRANRLYEGMNITEAQGLTEAQRHTLVALGAIDVLP